MAALPGSFENLRDREHLLNILPASQLRGVYGKVNKIGGSVVFLNERYVNVDDDDDEDLSYEIEIYGARGLLVGQYGYSYNPVQKAVIEDWNPNYVVIANCNADPYCIDISMDNSPVYYAVHGEGEWEFEKDSESLEEFFEFLGIR